MALLLAVRRVTKLSFFDKMCFQNRFFNCSNRVSTSKEFDIWQYPVIQQYYSAYEDLVGLTEVKSAQEKVLNVSICNLLTKHEINTYHKFIGTDKTGDKLSMMLHHMFSVSSIPNFSKSNVIDKPSISGRTDVSKCPSNSPENSHVSPGNSKQVKRNQQRIGQS